MSEDQVRIRLEPLSIELAAPRGAALRPVLAAQGFEFPCGGTRRCGGCGLRVLAGRLLITEADRAAFTPARLDEGWRLACQARAEDSLVLECAQWRMEVLTASRSGLESRERGERPGFGIAVDLGTTTVAAQLIELSSGNVLAVETGLNPQAGFGADVMSRLHAALEGADLTTPIRKFIGGLVAALARGRERHITTVVLVGNTAMHHLFCGCQVDALTNAPFHSPELGQKLFVPGDVGWELPESCTIQFANCIGGFVGSDTLAGILATGIAQSRELVALIDLGTNGEIAMGDCSRIVCASTAAGPAFEAGSIRMGMRAVAGAIAHVRIEAGKLKVSTIGDAEPCGICGSGIVDAVAAGLATGTILPSGRLAGGAKQLAVGGSVLLDQADIRELQLAKGALAAGFRLLLRHFNAEASDLKAIYLAGAFGNYVDIGSAVRIGLIPAPPRLICPVGNAALHGARLLVSALHQPNLCPIEHISLAADPTFEEQFAACIPFPAQESRSFDSAGFANN